MGEENKESFYRSCFPGLGITVIVLQQLCNSITVIL